MESQRMRPTAFNFAVVPAFSFVGRARVCSKYVNPSNGTPSNSGLSVRTTVECRRNAGKTKDKRRGDGRRSFRVGELIRREISPIIDDAFATAFDSEAGSPVLVSVVDVTCSPDLRNARVSINIMANEDQKLLIMKWLKDTRKSLRFELAQCLHMKYVPDLIFGESEITQAAKTVNILEMLAHEREKKAEKQAGVALAPPVFSIETGIDLNANGADALLDDDPSDSDTISPSYTMATEFSSTEPEIVEDPGNGDPVIVDIGEDDEDLEGMSDEAVRKLLFSSLDLEEGTDQK